MTVLRHELRPGLYLDSIVLMQLRATLAEEPGVLDAGAVMALAENLALLEASGLLPRLRAPPRPSDLLIVVKAETAAAGQAALARVDALLERERSGSSDEYRPRSLAAATRLLPAARWVWVSVPGRYAAAVAGEALELDRHVFLFSDNVPLEDEAALKREAWQRGLLVMGPDCGTAYVNGVGFGFANRVRRGPIGIVAASGTGLQVVSCGIHARGSGLSHAIGTGSRDLSAAVGGVTALQGLDLLARDPETRVIVLISKPPAAEVAGRLLEAARGTRKPVVVYFLGGSAAVDENAAVEGNPALSGKGLRLAGSLEDAADLAVEQAGTGRLPREPEIAGTVDADTPTVGVAEPDGGDASQPSMDLGQPPMDTGQPPAHPGCLRGLFAGGTLALEALYAARRFLEPGSLHSNLEVPGVRRLPDPEKSAGHAVLDLGADAFTLGRPHPMLDQELRIRRLRQEAADPEVGLLLLDVVLGDGAHPDPAAELASAIAQARKERALEIVAVVVGTEEDPQDMESQLVRLGEAGARTFRSVARAMEHVRRMLSVPRVPSAAPDSGSARREAGRVGGAETDGEPSGDLAPGLQSSFPELRETAVPVSLEALSTTVAAINVGAETFHRSLVERGVRALQVDWRPPAGGDERLAAILARLRS